MIEVGKKSKIKLKWNVNPYDYSKEKEQSLIAKLSKKYSLPKDRIKILPQFIMLNEKGEATSVATDIISNIQNPQFQLKLFNEYLEVNNILNYDFDLIKQIDAEINAHIDYDIYDKYKRYSIKWVKWSNFLSYGEDNYFDFSDLKGLVLLSGEPANQSGKTTFAIDLLHFLLFGKTDKATTQDKIFNKHLKEATEVIVEGCLNIDGEDYVIKRTLSRPSLQKRSAKSKTTQKVSYYKIVGSSLEELADEVEIQEGENSVQTNKIIKEAIGQEADFDMILCATSSNLDDLIEKKDTERGRLLSRWIGLLPIEQKDALAREKFNSKVKPTLLSNRYNIESLKQEIEAYTLNMNSLTDNIGKLMKENESIDIILKELEEKKTMLLQSKNKIDDSLLKVDITTLNATIEKLTNDGKTKNSELINISKEIDEIGDVAFSNEDFDALSNELANLSLKIGECRATCNSTKTTIKQLKTSEYCPTCGKKYDNVDNTAKINELNKTLGELISNGQKMSEDKAKLEERLNKAKEIREIYDRKSKLIIKKSALELNIEQLRNAYKEKKQILIEYQKNNEAIDKNNQLDILIRNNDVLLKDKQNTKEYNFNLIKQQEFEVKNHQKAIVEREQLIEDLKKEEVLLRNWKLYLEMIGKNGISKMVLRKSLPIINTQIAHLLSDVCDFTVLVEITEKSDIMFYLLKDGVKSDLTSASGFERTASALALRTVLGNISTLPRCNYIIFDEIWGRVAKENFDNVKTLVDKIAESYDAIIQISHLSEIVDWHDTHIVVRKENNISKLKLLNIEKK